VLRNAKIFVTEDTKLGHASLAQKFKVEDKLQKFLGISSYTSKMFSAPSRIFENSKIPFNHFKKVT